MIDSKFQQKILKQVERDPSEVEPLDLAKFMTYAYLRDSSEWVSKLEAAYATGLAQTPLEEGYTLSELVDKNILRSARLADHTCESLYKKHPHYVSTFRNPISTFYLGR